MTFKIIVEMKNYIRIDSYIDHFWQSALVTSLVFRVEVTDITNWQMLSNANVEALDIKHGIKIHNIQ